MTPDAGMPAAGRDGPPAAVAAAFVAPPLPPAGSIPAAVLTSVEAGETSVLEEWLAYGGDPNGRDRKERTLLMLAVSSCNSAVVDVLLRRGADPDLKQPDGVTTLMFASMAGNAAGVRLLLSARADTDIRDNRGLTAHDYSSLKGHYFISCLLLQHTVRHGHPTTSSSNDDSFRSGVERPHSGTDRSKGSGVDVGGRASSEAEARESGASTANSASGASQRRCSVADAAAASPQSVASRAGRRLPEPDAPARLPAWMLEAAQQGDVAAVGAYLAQGGDVNAVDDELLGTMLMCAASAGHAELACALLEAGAEVDVRDGNGCTALATASFSEQPQIALLLVRAGATLDNQDLLGLTALMVAALSGTASVIRVLLGAGATTDLRDSAGRTAYDYAQINGHLVARKLLRAHRLGRATRLKPPALSDEVMAAREAQASAAATEQLAYEAEEARAAAATVAKKSTRRLHKSRKERKDRRRGAPGCSSDGSRADDSRADDSTAGSASDSTNELGALQPLRMPLGGGFLGGGSALWSVYDTTSGSSHDAADASYMTWAGAEGEAEGGAEAMSVASLASSVAASALDDRSAADDTPHMLICPLTRELMRDPVSTVDGQVYERDAILRWLEKHDTSPLTGEALPIKLLIPSLPLRSMISARLERQKLRLSNAATHSARRMHSVDGSLSLSSLSCLGLASQANGSLGLHTHGSGSLGNDSLGSASPVMQTLLTHGQVLASPPSPLPPGIPLLSQCPPRPSSTPSQQLRGIW